MQEKCSKLLGILNLIRFRICFITTFYVKLYVLKINEGQDQMFKINFLFKSKGITNKESYQSYGVFTVLGSGLAGLIIGVMITSLTCILIQKRTNRFEQLLPIYIRQNATSERKRNASQLHPWTLFSLSIARPIYLLCVCL